MGVQMRQPSRRLLPVPRHHARKSTSSDKQSCRRLAHDSGTRPRWPRAWAWAWAWAWGRGSVPSALLAPRVPNMRATRPRAPQLQQPVMRTRQKEKKKKQKQKMSQTRCDDDGDDDDDDDDDDDG